MKNCINMQKGDAAPSRPPVTRSRRHSKGLALVMATLALCALMSAKAPEAEARRQTWLGTKVGQVLQYNKTGVWGPYKRPYHPPTVRIPHSRPATPVHRAPRYSAGPRFI